MSIRSKSQLALVPAVLIAFIVITVATILMRPRGRGMEFQIFARSFEVFHQANGRLAFATVGTANAERGIGALDAATGKLLWFVSNPAPVLLTSLDPGKIVMIANSGIDKNTGPIFVIVIDVEKGHSSARYELDIDLGAIYRNVDDRHLFYFGLGHGSYLRFNIDTGNSDRIAALPKENLADVYIWPRTPRSFRLAQLASEDFEGFATLPFSIKDLVDKNETLVRAVRLGEGVQHADLFWLETTGHLRMGQLSRDRSKVLWSRSFAGGIPAGRERAWGRRSFFGIEGRTAVFDVTPIGSNVPTETTILGVDVERGTQIWQSVRHEEVVEQTYLEGGRYYRLLYTQPGPLKFQIIDAANGREL